VFGIGIAFLLEMKINAFQTEKEVMRSLGLVLVLEVPILRTKAEQRSRSWKMAYEALVGCALALVICATQYYVYRRG
jgi:hypothetical protein